MGDRLRAVTFDNELTYPHARSLYYQYDVSRLSACPLTIHALLHIGSSIKANGPVWTNWTFPMERYCGDVVRHIKNRRYPYISINNYVTASAQLSQLKLRYNLYKELSFGSRPDQDDHAGRVYDGCKQTK